MFLSTANMEKLGIKESSEEGLECVRLPNGERVREKNIFFITCMKVE